MALQNFTYVLLIKKAALLFHLFLLTAAYLIKGKISHINKTKDQLAIPLPEGFLKIPEVP